MQIAALLNVLAVTVAAMDAIQMLHGVLHAQLALFLMKPFQLFQVHAQMFAQQVKQMIPVIY
jgi:hypothetical protein